MKSLSDDRALLDVIDSIYEASLVPDNWNFALAKIQHLFDAEGVALFFADERSTRPPIVTSTGIEQEYLQLYERRYADVDPTLKAARSLPLGSFIASYALMSDSAWERSEMYNEVMRPGGRFYIIGCNLLRERGAYGTIGIQRSRRRGPLMEWITSSSTS